MWFSVVPRWLCLPVELVHPAATDIHVPRARHVPPDAAAHLVYAISALGVGYIDMYPMGLYVHFSRSEGTIVVAKVWDPSEHGACYWSSSLFKAHSQPSEAASLPHHG